jgi:hypothetical protein
MQLLSLDHLVDDAMLVALLYTALYRHCCIDLPFLAAAARPGLPG